MSSSSVSSDLPPEWPPGELDEGVFRSIAEDVIVPVVAPPGQDGAGPGPLQDAIEKLARKLDKRELPVEQTVATLLDTMVNALGETWIGGPWDPKEDIRRHTTGHLDGLRGEYRKELAYMLRTSLEYLTPDEQIRQLLHVWRQCFERWDRSLAYRTIEAATAAVDDIAKDRTWADEAAWQRATWCAVGKALALMKVDGVLFAQTSLSCSAEVYNGLDGSIRSVKEIRDDLGRAWQLLADHLAGQPIDHPDRPGQQKIQDCVSYMWIYAAQIAGFYSVIKKMAGALLAFEGWLAEAGHADRQREPGTAPPALRPLSLSQTPRASILESLKYLEEIKRHLSSHTLSEIEPWEQLLIGLLDLMPDIPQPGVTPSVLIPRQVWVRYCYPFAVQLQNGSEELTKQLLRALPETAAEREQDHGQPGTPRHRLSRRLKEELALVGLDMKIEEPVDLAQTMFFQVGTGEDGHFGGIRIDLPGLEFAGPDFLNSSGHRPYQAWLDLNRMGNFCLCVEAAEPLTEIPPDRLYRALRAGTPFVYGEPVRIAGQGPPEEASGEADKSPQWDNLHMFARSMIGAAANAYYFRDPAKASEVDSEGRIATAPYVRANLHEVVIVQTDAAISLQSEEIADRLDNAVGGRILLRSLQRASATLDEWTRFPPLQRSELRARGAAVVAVPEIGYSGDWFAHTGETTVFGIVAVPAWFRDVYFEVAQFASSWSPVLQLWNRRLQDAITTLREHLDTSPRRASETLRDVEQEVRRHLAEMNAEDLCATLAYRGFLDSLLDAVGVGRLQNELETQLQAAEQLADYYYQHQEQQAARRRDLLLFFIALFGIFGIADFLALLDTAPYHAHVGWPDALVLILFALALGGGVIALLWNRLNGWLRLTGRSAKKKKK